MKIPPLPENEEARLASVHSYHLLDTLPEPDYDNLTKLAAAICDMPVSLITLVDERRQWFKSAYGLSLKETPRDYAFCAHAILTPEEVTIVPDAHNDERFAGNPLVEDAPNVVFYAGVPLNTADGYPLGSLCVIDNKPNDLTDGQVDALKTLAQQVVRLIELHKSNRDLQKSRAHLQEVNKELKRFAQMIASDLQKPCDTIDEIVAIVMEKYASKLDVDGQQILSLIQYSCENIKYTIADTLQRAQLVQLHQEDKMLVSVSQLMDELKGLLPSPVQKTLQYEANDTRLYTYKKMVLQILLCFVSNSISYNCAANKKVEVMCCETEQHYQFVITDNGMGLPVIQRNGLFEIFDLAESAGKNDYKGYLSNLNYARQLVHKLNGKIEAAFEQGKGSRFVFSIGR